MLGKWHFHSNTVGRPGRRRFRIRTLSTDAAERAASQNRAESSSHQGTLMHADVTSSVACKAIVYACLRKHGRVDIWVNNVGNS